MRTYAKILSSVLLVVFSFCSIQAAYAGTCRVYVDSVYIKSTKPNGYTWDEVGDCEAPDPYLSFGKAHFPTKQDVYQVYWQNSKEWSCKRTSTINITLWDSDLLDDDRVFYWSGTVDELLDVSAFGGLKGESLHSFSYRFSYTD